MFSLKITRSRAFFTHLIFSLVLLAVLLYLLTQHWYPGVFFHIDGGWDGLKIILGCDIVLGPLLTLVIFKPGKKGLWFDVVCIAIVQTSALVTGTWIVYAERPLALVYENDRFFSLTRSSYTYLGLPIPDLSALPGAPPKRIFIDLPSDPTAKKNLMAEYKSAGKLTRTDVKLYQPLEPNWSKVIDAGGITVEGMLELFPNSKTEIDAWLQEHNRTSENILFIPIAAASTWRFLYVDPNKPDILGITSTALKPGL